MGCYKGTGGCEDGRGGWQGWESGRESESIGNKRRIGVMCRHRADVGSTFLEDSFHQIKKQKSNS